MILLTYILLLFFALDTTDLLLAGKCKVVRGTKTHCVHPPDHLHHAPCGAWLEQRLHRYVGNETPRNCRRAGERKLVTPVLIDATPLTGLVRR